MLKAQLLVISNELNESNNRTDNYLNQINEMTNREQELINENSELIEVKTKMK
jgi:hypothetical protein